MGTKIDPRMKELLNEPFMASVGRVTANAAALEQGVILLLWALTEASFTEQKRPVELDEIVALAKDLDTVGTEAMVLAAEVILAEPSSISRAGNPSKKAPTLRTMLDELSRLAPSLLVADSSLRDRIEEFVTRCRDLSERRNRVVHDVIEQRDDGTLERLRSSWKGG